jgi:hypothetical protein
MSHQIKVEGNFGSRECLEATLREAKQNWREEKSGSDTFFVMERPYNPIRICVNDQTKTTIDHMNRAEVEGWYRDSMTRYVKQRLLVDGHQVASETRQGQNIVLRVAVG